VTRPELTDQIYDAIAAVIAAEAERIRRLDEAKAASGAK
jgi:hypothetical protein